MQISRCRITNFMIYAVCFLFGLFGHVKMFPVDKAATTTTDIGQKQHSLRNKVPLLKPEQRVKRGTNNDLSQAKINLFQIQNLDIKNGILRNLMIKPIPAKK